MNRKAFALAAAIASTTLVTGVAVSAEPKSDTDIDLGDGIKINVCQYTGLNDLLDDQTVAIRLKLLDQLTQASFDDKKRLCLNSVPTDGNDKSTSPSTSKKRPNDADDDKTRTTTKTTTKTKTEEVPLSNDQVKRIPLGHPETGGE